MNRPAPPPYPQQQPVYYTEYTPLVNERYFYVYRHNDTFLERLRRALAFILLTCLLSFLFFAMFSMLLQIINIEQPYHYFLMTKRWPASECAPSNSKCIPNLERYDRWLIHGLWPEFSNNTWDQYCTKSTFNITEVAKLKPELLQSWPNLLRDQSDDSLWAHEWNKHGTCSKLSQFDYFAHTLVLHRRYNIDQWLADENILPSHTKQYTVSQLRDAIGKHIDRDVVAFNCERIHRRQLLKEIYLCVSFEDAQTLITCTVDDTCHGEFYYPQLNQTENSS